MTDTLVKPKVAVCLAVYNGSRWLDEQIDTILQQKGVLPTVFVSVDLSSDASESLVDERAAADSRIVVLPHGHRMGSAAKNFFRLIRDVNFDDFDYVSFADQDDVWLDNKLSHAIEKIQSLEVDAVSSDVVAFWEDGKERLVKKSYPQKQYDHYFESPGPGCTYVMTADSLRVFKEFLLENWGEVNEVALHDWLMYAYYRQHSMRWYIDDKPLMRYRQHSANEVGFNYGLKAYAKRISQVRQKWYRNEVEKIARLIEKGTTQKLQMNRWFLIRNFWQLRRRSRDAYVLLVMMLIGWY